VALAAGVYGEALRLVDRLRARLRVVAAMVAKDSHRPRVLSLEGLVPLCLGEQITQRHCIRSFGICGKRLRCVLTGTRGACLISSARVNPKPYLFHRSPPAGGLMPVGVSQGPASAHEDILEVICLTSNLIFMPVTHLVLIGETNLQNGLQTSTGLAG